MRERRYSGLRDLHVVLGRVEACTDRGLQGEQIMRQPVVIVLLAVPILIQVYFNAGLAYWLNRQLGVEWRVAGPSALIGASNFFELAVATAIALFGFQSARHSRRSLACWWKCRSCCR